MIDEGGLDALSMRRLAAALQVDPMALYHYFPNKSELLAHLIEEAFARLRLPDDLEGTWQQRLKKLAHVYRRMAHAHPKLFPLIAIWQDERIPIAFEVDEAIIAALEEVGLEPSDQLHAAEVLYDFILGFCLSEISGALFSAERTREHLEKLPAERFPAVLRMYQALGGVYNIDYDRCLVMVIAGIAALAAEPS